MLLHALLSITLLLSSNMWAMESKSASSMEITEQSFSDINLSQAPIVNYQKIRELRMPYGVIEMAFDKEKNQLITQCDCVGTCKAQEPGHGLNVWDIKSGMLLYYMGRKNAEEYLQKHALTSQVVDSQVEKKVSGLSHNHRWEEEIFYKLYIILKNKKHLWQDEQYSSHFKYPRHIAGLENTVASVSGWKNDCIRVGILTTNDTLETQDFKLAPNISVMASDNKAVHLATFHKDEKKNVVKIWEKTFAQRTGAQK